MASRAELLRLEVPPRKRVSDTVPRAEDFHSAAEVILENGVEPDRYPLDWLATFEASDMDWYTPGAFTDWVIARVDRGTLCKSLEDHVRDHGRLTPLADLVARDASEPITPRPRPKASPARIEVHDLMSADDARAHLAANGLVAKGTGT